jgi:hypothetical protein
MTVILTGCGWLIGIGNLLKSIIFVLFTVLCLLGDTSVITRYLGHKKRSLSIILAAWYGFTFGLLTLLGMLLDQRSVAFSWAYRLSVVGVVCFGTFLFIILMLPISKAFLSFWQRNFGNPMGRLK